MLRTSGGKEQRLVFYVDQIQPNEIEAINEFKLWCVQNDVAVPETDQEILRHLYGAKMQSQGAYDSIIAKYTYQKENFPLLYTEDVKRVLENGIVYTSGRDRCYRPIIYIHITKLVTMDPPITQEDLITHTFT